MFISTLKSYGHSKSSVQPSWQSVDLCFYTCTGPYSGTVMLRNDVVELNLFYTFFKKEILSGSWGNEIIVNEF